MTLVGNIKSFLDDILGVGSIAAAMNSGEEAQATGCNCNAPQLIYHDNARGRGSLSKAPAPGRTVLVGGSGAINLTRSQRYDWKCRDMMMRGYLTSTRVQIALLHPNMKNAR